MVQMVKHTALATGRMELAAIDESPMLIAPGRRTPPPLTGPHGVVIGACTWGQNEPAGLWGQPPTEDGALASMAGHE